uniref:TACC_C domain-containing protein n=1 Tax=Globodera pallida TaxID=36090 RepID=A0A183BPR3_GLOPA
MRLNCVNLKEVVEQSLRAELDGLGQKYGALHKMYTELLVEAQKKLEDANEELRHSDKEHVQKTMALRLALKRAQIRLGSVEKALELKNKENAELHDICGQLIEAPGSSSSSNSNSSSTTIRRNFPLRTTKARKKIQQHMGGTFFLIMTIAHEVCRLARYNLHKTPWPKHHRCDHGREFVALSD